MNFSDSALVVVTPYFEDRDSLRLLLSDLREQFGQHASVLVVDDGSIEATATIDALQAANLHGSIVTLKRNVGHQKAIFIGMSLALGTLSTDSTIVVMDSDGEDLPATIPQLLGALADERTDVAVAVRKSRVTSRLFKVFYLLYQLIFRALSGRQLRFGNFMAMSFQAAKRLVSMQELPIHLAATVLLSRLRISPVMIDRGARYAGQSKMNLVALLLHGFKALMVFAEDVLVRVGFLSAIIAGFSIVAGATAVTLKLFGYATPGWFSIALGILLLIFLQVGTLALMMLMLTGVSRGANASPNISYSEYIDSIVTHKKDKGSPRETL